MERKDTRSGFGDALAKLAENDKVFAITCDLKGSVKMDKFAKAAPERFIQGGIAEANAIGVAAGLAIAGNIPFVGSFAEFVTGRVYDQIRQSVCYAGANVKIAASHAGITLGEDGATHQTMEDIALMRALPGMCIVAPCDYNQAYNATLAVAEHNGPVYLRLGRPTRPIFTDIDRPFEIGKTYVEREVAEDCKKDMVTILAYGHTVYEALEAANRLSEQGIECEVLNAATIVPLDIYLICDSIRKTGRLLVVEEHNEPGGLMELTVSHLRGNFDVAGCTGGRKFGQSGTPDELMHAYGLDADGICYQIMHILFGQGRQNPTE